MISRVADTIYWMSRYLERSENTSRCVHVNLHLNLDIGINASENQWLPIVNATGDHEDFVRRYGEATEDKVLRFLTFDRENPNSILSCVSAARENARSVRDTISVEMWEHLNELYLMIQKNSRKRKVGDLQEFFAKVKRANQSFIGMADATMSHGEEWHFLRLGRMMERADQTARIMDVKYFILLPDEDFVGSSFDAVQWGALLKSVSGFEMYKKKYHNIDYKSIADFLIFDPYFPRSLTYCVDMAKWSIENIVQANGNHGAATEEINKLNQMLLDSKIEDVLGKGLHGFVDVFQLNLNVVNAAIRKTFMGIDLE